MFDFHEKRKIRSVVYSVPFILFLFVIALLLFTSVKERFTVERDMAAKLEGRETELQELNERAAALETSVAHLRNERGIEEEIRGRFDVAKKGEQVVIILDERETNVEESASTSRENGEEERSFLDVLKFW